jgi:hypothetical protein
MTELQRITIGTNPWCVPSVEHATDGWLEGGATETEIRQAREKEQQARAAWKPTEEGMRLVEQIRGFVGTRLQIQFWDSSMFMCEEEGPFPLEGDCKNVLLLQPGEFLQAFMVLDNVRVISAPEGYTPLGYLISVDGVPGQLAPLADVYEVFPVDAAGRVDPETEKNRIMAVRRYNATTRGVRKQLKSSMTVAQLDTLYPLWPTKTKKQNDS